MFSGNKFISELENIEDNADNLRYLIEQLKTPIGVIPFIGAGLSIPFGFPGWAGFLTAQAKRTGIEAKINERLDHGEYEEAAEDLLKGRGYLAFHDAITNIFGVHKLTNKDLKGAVSYLPQLVTGPVITTNFDHVLEEVFRQANAPFEREVWGANSEMAIRALVQNKRFLLKIHGDAEASTDRILTRNDYIKHYGSSDGSTVDLSLPLPRLLQQMLLGRPLLFLGCSLNQDRTIAVLKEVSSSSRFIAHYAVVEKPASLDSFYERSRFLADHNIRPIWYPWGRHDLVEPLLAHLVEKRSSQGLFVFNISSPKQHIILGNSFHYGDSFSAGKSSKDELNDYLERLTHAVEVMIKELPKERAEEATTDLRILTEEAKKAEPKHKWVTVAVDGLIVSAQNLGKIGDEVIELAGKVRTILTGGLL